MQDHNCKLPKFKLSAVVASCLRDAFAPIGRANKGFGEINTYILLTKREGRTGRISARGLDSTDRAQRGPYKKDQGPIFSQYGPEQVWLIRDLLHD